MLLGQLQRYLSRRGWLFTTLASVFSALGFRWHTTRPACQSGIPQRDYQFINQSEHRREFSKTVQLVGSSTPEATPSKAVGVSLVHVYQLNQPALTVQHCSISEFAFQLDSQGLWRVNLRAEQNPIHQQNTPLPSFTGSRPSQDDRTFVKRNRFHIIVRGVAFSSVVSDAEQQAIGRPQAFEVRLKPFWVQRGEPRTIVEHGKLHQHEIKFVQGHAANADVLFSRVDRVEVEFYFDE